MDSYAHVGLGGYDATTETKLSDKLHSTYDSENPLFRRDAGLISMSMLPTIEALTRTVLSQTTIVPDPTDIGINGGDTNG